MAALDATGMDEQRQTFSDIVQSREALLRTVTHAEWNAIIDAAKRQDEEAAAKATTAQAVLARCSERIAQ